jgi:hypothetical protein
MKQKLLNYLYSAATLLGSGQIGNTELVVVISCASAILASLFGVLAPAGFFVGYCVAMVLIEARYDNADLDDPEYVRVSVVGTVQIAVCTTAVGAFLEFVFAVLTGGHWSLAGRCGFPFSLIIYMLGAASLGAASVALLTPSFLDEFRQRLMHRHLATMVVPTRDDVEPDSKTDGGAT